MGTDIHEWKEECYSYFTRHDIVNREQLRAKLKKTPLKVEGLTNAIIEGIFSCFNKERREQLKREQEANKNIKNYSVACLSDLHIPQHDELTVQNVFTFLKKIEPNEVILLGDIIDCYWESRFEHNPDCKLYLQDECDTFYRLFKPLVKSLPKTKFVYLPGNHEDRIRQKQWKDPSFFGVRGLTLQNLLRLDELGIEFHDYKYEVNNVVFTHGVKCSQYSSYTARAEHDKRRKCGVSGHTHRLGGYWFTVNNTEVTEWHENGCLCDRYPDYTDEPNWQQGFTFINFHNSVPHMQSIPILDHVFDYGGQLYGKSE